MRVALAFALTLAIAAPVHAQIDEDFAAAARIFGQVHPENIIADIDGEWLPLTTLSNLQGADPEPGLAESLLERICDNDPVRGAVITRIDGASFEMTAPNSNGEFVYRFDWVNGSQFHRSFDPASLFRLLKFDTMEGDRGIEIRARTLQTSTSHVNIYRISPDLIAVVEPHRAEVFGRCLQ